MVHMKVNNGRREKMLILSRKPSERIMIGNDIIVTVLAVNGCQVRVGIACDKDIPVHREEIYEKIKAGGRDNNG